MNVSYHYFRWQFIKLQFDISPADSHPVTTILIDWAKNTKLLATANSPHFFYLWFPSEKNFCQHESRISTTVSLSLSITDLVIRTLVGLWSQTDQKWKCLIFDHVGMLTEKLMLDTLFLFCWLQKDLCYIGHMSHLLLLLLKACCSSSSSNCSILSFSVCY